MATTANSTSSAASKVTRGQVIAKSGDTGNVNSPQLHFELRKGSTPVDPTSYLAGLYRLGEATRGPASGRDPGGHSEDFRETRSDPRKRPVRAAGPKKGPPPLILASGERRRHPTESRVTRSTRSEFLQSPPSTAHRDLCRNRHGSAGSASRRSRQGIDGADDALLAAYLRGRFANDFGGANQSEPEHQVGIEVGSIASGNEALAGIGGFNHLAKSNVSSGRILDRGCPQDLIAEVAAEILRCAQVHLSSVQKRRQLDLYLRHADQAGLGVLLEFNQQVDVAVGPRGAFQLRSRTATTAGCDASGRRTLRRQDREQCVRHDQPAKRKFRAKTSGHRPRSTVLSSRRVQRKARRP